MSDAIHWHELGAAITGNTFFVAPLTGTNDSAVVTNPQGRPVRINGQYVMYHGDSSPFYYATSPDVIHSTTRGTIDTGQSGELCVALTDYRAVKDAPLNHNIVLFTGGGSGGTNPSDPYDYAISEEEYSGTEPTKLLGQLSGPVLQPTESYEEVGFTPMTVFMNNITWAGGEWRMYYGAADTVTALATATWRKGR